MTTNKEINALFGNMDLYLMDYVLKEKLSTAIKILDAGCGEGRNLTYFAYRGVDIYGVDREPLAIKMCRMRFSHVPVDHFICQSLSEIPFEDGVFDLVISSAVLHFADSDNDFQQMWEEHTRVTKQGGKLFLRMASLWGGVEKSEFSYYLTDDDLNYMLGRGWTLAEPRKTVLVDNKRSMSALLFERG